MAFAGRLRQAAAGDGQPVAYGVRPDHLELSPGSERGVPGEIVVVEPTGSETELVVRIGEAQIIVEARGRATRAAWRQGDVRGESGERAPVRPEVGAAADDVVPDASAMASIDIAFIVVRDRKPQ